MPSSRQLDPTRELFDDDYLARALSVTYPDGHLLPPHQHPWPQLVYAAAGVMQVRTHTMA